MSPRPKPRRVIASTAKASEKSRKSGSRVCRQKRRKKSAATEEAIAIAPSMIGPIMSGLMGSLRIPDEAVEQDAHRGQRSAGAPERKVL